MHTFASRCLFQLILCISMHIYCIFKHTNAYQCIFQFCRSSALASPRPFWFRSCSTSQQQLHSNSLLPKHTHLSWSGEPWPALAPGLAGAWLCQNTWSTKLRKPLPISFTIIEYQLTLSLSQKQTRKVKYSVYMQNMPSLVGKLGRPAAHYPLPQSWRWDSG